MFYSLVNVYIIFIGFWIRVKWGNCKWYFIVWLENYFVFSFLLITYKLLLGYFEKLVTNMFMQVDSVLM